MRCYVVTCCCFNHWSNFTTSDHECNTFPRNHRFRFINKHWLMDLDNCSFVSRAERGIHGYRGVVFVLLHQLLSCGILRDTMILLMAEILHHMTCMKPCKSWDIYHINWCRIFFHQQYHDNIGNPELFLKNLHSILGKCHVQTAKSKLFKCSLFKENWRNTDENSALGSYHLAKL